MRSHGMMIGFRRSEQLHKLQYTGYLGDGDSKSHGKIASADAPVYQGKTVANLECTGHIQKRICNRCKKVIDNNKGKPFTHNGKYYKGIGGKGLLIDKKVKIMQGHYGAAIRDYPGDTAAKRKAIWAIYHHRSGNHADCPDWCQATKSGDFEKTNKNAFPSFVMQQLPVFKEL